MKRFSLDSTIALPYIALVVVLAVAIGTLSYLSGYQAITTLAENLLKEKFLRIGQQIAEQIKVSATALEVAFPEETAAPTAPDPDDQALIARLWLATSLNTKLVDHIYYGNRTGGAVSLYRDSAKTGALSVQPAAGNRPEHYRLSGESKPLFENFNKAELIDPRDTLWYQLGSSSESWLPVHLNPETGSRVITRLRVVRNQKGELEGVAAVDLNIVALNDVIDNLYISENGISFIIDTTGNLIATSAPQATGQNNDTNTIAASSTGNTTPLLSQTQLQLRPHLVGLSDQPHPQTLSFTDSDGKKIYVALSKKFAPVGLQWVQVLAIPAGDFMGPIWANITRTMLLGAAVTAMVIVVGLLLLRWVTSDLKTLSEAANRVRSGDLNASIAIQRKDEIGDLAESFNAIQHRLQTDQLTGLPNRAAFEHYLGDHIDFFQSGKGNPFAIFFTDLNGFKQLNDQYGHDAGDEALKDFARRLKNCVRHNDYVARYAGDEFVMLLADVRSADDMKKIRTTFGKALSTSLREHQLSPLKLDAAIGEAHFPEDGEDAESLLQIADKRMYAHKAEQKKGAEIAAIITGDHHDHRRNEP